MKERYREIGLTVLFLLFVIGMSIDIPGIFKKEEKSQVLAAKTQKPKKIVPSPTRTPTPTTAWPTWTPTPIESGSTSMSSSSPTPTNTPSTSQQSPTTTPQPEVSSGNQTMPTVTPHVVGQVQPIDGSSERQFPNDEPGRGGLSDIVEELTDPLDKVLPLAN